MASKRKSTTPCMIPSKAMRLQEDLEPEPPVLPRQARISGGGRQSPQDPGESSKPEAGDMVRDGAGTYTCRPCNFETHDLNLFLDHVYSGHPDFRADPSFLCVDCGVSAAKFEGLALHNARVHPSTVTTVLQLRKRDRRVVVEQNLVTGTEAGRDTEISITKTPIMRLLKGKSEPKRIVVSHQASDEPSSDPHSVSASREAEKKETPTVTVTHVPTIVHNGAATKVTLPSAIQIVNGSGALPMLKTAITQVVSVVQNRHLHQSAPITISSLHSTSSASSKHLPKVMIPLSSIPTYSASMDSSSFLKTSFSKFPYPTKAELCYLTVVTKFPEEQIKIWFTAQRLKQGISWSPEEIDEARRKMFNTIIQTAPSSSQTHRHSHHGPAHHTITVLPASLGTSGIPHILQGSLMSQGGVIVTHPIMANGIQLSSAPMALAVTPKPQAAARPMMQARPAAALVADKGINMVVGTVGSSGSNIISSSNSNSRNGGGSISSILSSSSSIRNSNNSSNQSSQATVINLSLGNSNHSITTVKVNNVSGSANLNGKSISNTTSNASTAKGSSDIKNIDINKTNTTSAAKNNTNYKVTTDIKSSTDGNPNNGNSKHNSNGQKNNSSSNKNSNTSPTGAPTGTATPTASTTTTATNTTSNSPAIKTEAASSPASKSSSPASKSSSPSPATPSSSSSGSRTLPNTFLDPSFYKSKKSQEQLNALKDSFQVNQFPNQEEVDRLISLTGLTVREVRKWFSDRRYHFRNLKGSRSSTGSQSRSAATAGAGSGSSASGSGTAGSASPMDLSDSSATGADKTPQHGSAPLSPTGTQTPTSPTTPSRRAPRPPSPDFTAIRYKEREPHQVRALEASFAQDPDPPGEEVDRLRAETKMTRREIHGWFAEKRKRVAAERKKEEAERAVREEKEMMMMDVERAEAKGGDGVKKEKEEEEEKQKEDGSGELKVNPIKINLKMLKVTEANGKPESEGSASPTMPPPSSTTPTPSPGPTPSSTPKPAPSQSPRPSPSSTPTPKPSQSPKPSAIRGKKTAEQLHLLKLVYSRTQWPNASQYDELISDTGLPRPEVVRWFGDCRYVQKNGQLKWLEAYQDTALDEDLQKGDTQILQAHLDSHGSLEESKVPELVHASGLTEEQVRRWFSSKTGTTQPQSEETTAAAATSADKTEAGPVTPEPEPEPPVPEPPVPEPPQTAGSGSSPPEPAQGEVKEEEIEQSVCGVTKEEDEVKSEKTVNPTNGTD